MCEKFDNVSVVAHNKTTLQFIVGARLQLEPIFKKQVKRRVVFHRYRYYVNRRKKD